MTLQTRRDIFHKQLVLIGGGHSHALIARMFGMRPLTGVKIVLISDVFQAPYSGMLPGYLAGLYNYDETHIDLARLCRFAGIEFILGKVKGLDPEKKEIRMQDRPAISYDVVSINIGSTPGLADVPGASTFATPVKPVPVFLASFDKMIAGLQESAAPDQRIVLVGGGAAGVEVSLGLRRRIPARHQVILIHRGCEILQEMPRSVREFFRKELSTAGVEVRTNSPVDRVEAKALFIGGQSVLFDQLFWMTQASPASWLKQSGLVLDGRGFIAVQPTMQSLLYPDVFAAGDVATIAGSQRAKAGVFAVRHAMPLAANLRAYIRGQKLVKFRPQAKFLVIVGTGAGRACAMKGKLSVHGSWVWKWKDYIDRKFMRQFADLQPMTAFTGPVEPDHDASQEKLQKRAAIRCLGCASKVGGDVLRDVLSELAIRYPDVHKDGVSTGLAEADDAAVFRVGAGQSVIQSIDYLTALVSDPYLLGRIAIAHSFSDIFAMGGTAHSAMALANIPYSKGLALRHQLMQLLSGIVVELTSLGAVLTGGHTTETSEFGIGISAVGTVDGDAILRKSGMNPGDKLILTKGLGTGLIFAAEMQLKAKGRWLEAAIASMLKNNATASVIARKYGALACTDVTGFGLAGHLSEMLNADLECGRELTAVLTSDLIPLLPGARECASMGIESTLAANNALYVDARSYIRPAAKAAGFLPYLFDPQTSGGLLFAVAAAKSAQAVADLAAAGLPEAAVVGTIEAFHESRIILI